MTRNILAGILFCGAIALASCSTQNKLASADNNDDVYNTKAKAGDAPVYAVRQNTYQQDNDDSQYIDEDYGYYDSYAARLNRFYNYSPFLSSYYDDLYYGGYTPYYSGYSLGFGLGYGYYGGGYFGYNPFTFYGGYNPYWGYSNYGYYGSTIGYGASPYWGAYSYYNVARTYNNPRPYRGSGVPSAGGIGGVGRTTVGSNRNGTMVSYGNGAYLPVRGNNTASSNGRTTYSNGNNNGNSGARPVRTSDAQPRPVYQPQSQPQSAPASSAGSSSGSSSGGGGGGRPVRP